jgi:hypothetical protein
MKFHVLNQVGTGDRKAVNQEKLCSSLGLWLGPQKHEPNNARQF